MSKNKKQINELSELAKTKKPKPLSMAEFAETFKQHGYKEIWSKYPFREGTIKAIYSDGSFPKHGATRPITQKQIDDITRIMQQPFELESLRSFLDQNFNSVQFDKLTWTDILRHFQRFYINTRPVGLVSLDKYDRKILLALNTYNELVFQVDLEAETGIGRKTISEKLLYLQKSDYICYPKGNKGGVSITDLGRKALSPKKES